MKTSVFHVLRLAEFLIEAYDAEPEMAEHLVRKGFSLAWPSQGKERLQGTRGLLTRRDAMHSALKEATDSIRRLYRGLESEVGNFRFAAWRATYDRPGIALALGVARERRVLDAPPAGSLSNDEGGALPKAVKKRKFRDGGMVRQLSLAGAMLHAALQSTEAISLLESYGYGPEGITALLAHVESLQRSEMDHERMKASLAAATSALHGRLEEFRRWFHPWRRRILTALSDRPDLRRLLDRTV